MLRRRGTSGADGGTEDTIAAPAGPDVNGVCEGVKQAEARLRQSKWWQRAAVLLQIFLLYFAGLFIYPILIYLAWTRYPLLWFAMIEYLFYVCSKSGRAAARTGENGWPTPLRRWGLYRIVADYFPLRLHKTVEYEAGRPYLCTLHPHGILAFSGFVGFATNGANYDEMFPGANFHGMTLEISFKTPFLREFHLLHGTRDVSRETFHNILNAGGTVGVVVGGGTEALHCAPGKNRIILRRRKGFIKLALRTGALLVPSWAFGENNLYRTANHLPPTSRVRRFQRWMMKRLGFTTPIFWGTGVFLPWGLVPYPASINVVMGPPLDVPKYEGPEDTAEFKALVDKYHGLYTTALQKLFDEHKERFAKGEGDLEIVE